MHSLKNTIIAVGLLGLSFLFYQASSTNHSDQTDLIPALEISEGGEELGPLAASDADSGKAAFDAMPKVELPDLRKPDFGKPIQKGSDFASKTPENAQVKNGGDFSISPFPNSISARNKATASDQRFPDLPIETPPAKLAILTPAPSHAMAKEGFTETTPAATIPSNAFNPGLKSTPPSVNRQPLDNLVRDKGLIKALEKQNWQKNQFVTAKVDRAAATSNHPSKTNEVVPFATQPIPSSDSSFIRVATDRYSGDAKRTDPGVVQAGSDFDFASLTYQAAWPQVDKFVAQENYQSALRLLSRYYRSTELTGPQRQRLIGWLDALAGKVIFSAEHHLQSTPYTVANESLADIGQRWKVPAQLIFNINQTNIPVVSAITPGTQLKAVQGPFNAEIDLNQKVMTLFLDDLYAGRYPIQVGISGSPSPGDFQVLIKSANGHSWRDSKGTEYGPGSPENGYGPYWFGLSGSLCIHAIPDSAREGHHGCIGLNTKDAKDVFAILAEGSSVKIIR